MIFDSAATIHLIHLTVHSTKQNKLLTSHLTQSFLTFINVHRRHITCKNGNHKNSSVISIKKNEEKENLIKWLLVGPLAFHNISNVLWLSENKIKSITSLLLAKGRKKKHNRVNNTTPKSFNRHTVIKSSNHQAIKWKKKKCFFLSALNHKNNILSLVDRLILLERILNP